MDIKDEDIDRARDRAIAARRHRIESVFCKPEASERIAKRTDEADRRFAARIPLAAAVIAIR